MKKQQWILVGVTTAFLCLLIGIFVGRNLTGSYIDLKNAGNSGSKSNASVQKEKDGRIDLNTATLQQLELLPGIGETIAQRILDYRTENGDFQVVEDLLKVEGIGEKKLEQIRSKIKVNGK